MSKASKTKTTQKISLDLDLLSFVSHELKTPLSTIKLNVEFLKKTSHLSGTKKTNRNDG